MNGRLPDDVIVDPLTYAARGAYHEVFNPLWREGLVR